MFGDGKQQNHEHDYPTSPWTEAYQAAPQRQNDRAEADMSRAFDSDDQRPTHDALSDIYNRGY